MNSRIKAYQEAKRRVEGAQTRQSSHLALDEIQLTLVPRAIQELPFLQVLELQDNRLTSLPEGIGQLQGLEYLDLSENQLVALPESFGQLQNLLRFYAHNNQLVALPESIGQLQKVEVVDLSYNQFTNFPDNLRLLKSLQDLEFQDNQLTNLPDSIGQLKNLKYLNLCGNQLANLPKNIGQLRNIVGVELQENLITNLPENIGQLQRLQYLDLSENQLTELPKSIGELQSLQYLNLSKNQLTWLPKSIGLISELVHLDLSGNQLTKLPESIELLETSWYLNLPSLLGELEGLQNLTTLYLSGNQLTSLPKSIGQLQKLTALYLSGNQLTSLPKSIGQLQNLTTLYLSDNQLTSLPESIGQLQNLTTLYLSGNPLTSPPIEIAAQGIDAIRTWFEANREGAPRPLHEVRLLFVGEGASGKTSLIHRLLGEDFNTDEAQTQGIEIHNHGVQVHKAEQNEIRLHFWDFGGQEVMHSTHQFFLSHRSLYVVVLDGRADPRTEYWLQHAESFGGGSPVLVVLNKIDTNPHFDVNRAFLLEKYPNILGFHRLSCKTDEGLDAFKKALHAALNKVEMTESQWPGRWFDVKQRLEEHEADYLDSDAFEELCEAAQLTDSEQREVLLKYLHDLGVAIHFRDFNLADLHVLKPHWITEAVYRIINARDLADVGGELRLGMLRDILKRSDKFPRVYKTQERRYVLELMKRFELCYDLGRDERVLLPDLLPVPQPDIRGIDLTGGLHLLIEYEFLPRSIMPRLMVRLHRDIDDALRWRTGVVLRNARFNTHALIRADHEAKQISIQVAGAGYRREHLAVIRNALYSIHDSFEVLHYEERIPCNCNVCRGLSRPHIFSYKGLLLAEKNQIPAICHRAEAVVSVEPLLSGVQWTPPPQREAWMAFVSHLTLDFGLAQELVLDLRERGIPYWLGREQLMEGYSHSDILNRGLTRSRFVLACLSRNLLRHGWQSTEWASVLPSARVVPLVLDDLRDEEVPLPLRDRPIIRYRDQHTYPALLARLQTEETSSYRAPWPRDRNEEASNALRELLWDCFTDGSELRAFCLQRNALQGLGRALPGGTSSSEAIVQSATGKLQTLGLLVPFFKALVSAREGHRARIAQVARTCGIDFDAPR